MTEPMRVLTVKQPWAWAILHAGKTVENRPRNVAGDYRGPVAIHAGLTLDGPALGSPLIDTSRWRGKYGVILGVVDLVDVHDADDDGWEQMPGEAPGFIRRTPCSPWAEYRKHLVLANPRPLPTPIRFKGALGLRRLPAEVEAEIRTQLDKATTYADPVISAPLIGGIR